MKDTPSSALLSVFNARFGIVRAWLATGCRMPPPPGHQSMVSKLERLFLPRKRSLVDLDYWLASVQCSLHGQCYQAVLPSARFFRKDTSRDPDLSPVSLRGITTEPQRGGETARRG